MPVPTPSCLLPASPSRTKLLVGHPRALQALVSVLAASQVALYDQPHSCADVGQPAPESFGSDKGVEFSSFVYLGEFFSFCIFIVCLFVVVVLGWNSGPPAC